MDNPPAVTIPPQSSYIVSRMKAAIDTTILWGPVLWRATLYFVISFLTSISDAVTEALKQDYWPTPQRWVLGIIVGLVSGAVAVRAYMDGSASRHADKLAEENGATP